MRLLQRPQEKLHLSFACIAVFACRFVAVVFVLSTDDDVRSAVVEPRRLTVLLSTGPASRHIMSLEETGDASVRQPPFQKVVLRADESQNSFKSRDARQIPLVSGCARGGTLSMQQFLNAAGIKAVHEQLVSGAVSVSWLYAVQNATSDPRRFPFETWSSAKLRRKLNQKAGSGTIFGPVVHLVRHPLAVISSASRCFCGIGSRKTKHSMLIEFKSWKFVEHFVPEMRGLAVDSITRSALYWLRWNQLIEENHAGKIVGDVIRLEDPDLPRLLWSLDRSTRPTHHSHPAYLSSNNSHKSKSDTRFPAVTWKRLHTEAPELSEQIFTLAQTYGYEQNMTLQAYL